MVGLFVFSGSCRHHVGFVVESRKAVDLLGGTALIVTRRDHVTAVELLESLNLLDEQERIEAKRASEAGKSILETVCAFADKLQVETGSLQRNGLCPT